MQQNTTHSDLLDLQKFMISNESLGLTGKKQNMECGLSINVGFWHLWMECSFHPQKRRSNSNSNAFASWVDFLSQFTNFYAEESPTFQVRSLDLNQYDPNGHTLIANIEIKTFHWVRWHLPTLQVVSWDLDFKSVRFCLYATHDP